ncbi:MAG: hypothetical protein RMJ37_04585 [Spirochaetia bacterium]|nr:hypothetical protein [Spirochaetota bacterium]MCX8096793.1 hypothetical protein [Spirochaetota bacterium]MDW8112604.1 hypothetical protein [Spirochaetia bacterium]
MKKIVFILLTLTTILIIYSCIEISATRITVQITKGSGNNYYEINIYSNSNLSQNNTNNFTFSLNDQNNVLLETSSGRLERGYSTWTSYRNYVRGTYIIVVKIDMTGDNNISSGGDVFSYKFVVITEDGNGTVSFSDLDNWYGL